MNGRPELAVVIPTLDEAPNVLPLLGDLASQRGIGLEVVVADGGSSDGTLRLVRECAREAPFPLNALSAPRGRGCQLNAGVAASSSPELLFLHADSRLQDPDLLADARRALASERVRRGSDRVAGHFGLRFRRSQPDAPFAYFFFESKTGLNRPDCVNGDQGFWLSRWYLDELGGFDESVPFFEDARLAARVFANGAWMTLPGWLSTSARRFEAEGLGRRQTLNAILRAADHLGWTDFFGGAAGAYREQSGAGSLDLLPFLKLAHRYLWRGGKLEGLRCWRRAGDYAASQAWQVAFWVDCRRRFRRGGSPPVAPHPFFDAFDRHGPRLLGSPLARAASPVLVALWFYSLFGWLCAMGAAKHLLNKPR